MEKRTTELLFLLGYLIIFGALFLIALYSFNMGNSVVNIGFDAKTTNILIMGLSFVGLIKSIYHLYIFERK